MKAYFDTTILVKNYCNEANSPDAISLILGESPPLPLTQLQEAELRNVLRLKVFRGERSLADLRLSLSLLDDDLRQGRMERVNYDMSAVHRKAEALSEQHTCTIGTRTLDILHVAAALEIGATRFVSFDQRQCGMAKKAGLKVVSKP